MCSQCTTFAAWLEQRCPTRSPPVPAAVITLKQAAHWPMPSRRLPVPGPAKRQLLIQHRTQALQLVQRAR